MVEATQFSEIEARERLREVEAETTAPIARVPSRWLYEGEQRMDGGHYSTDATRALLAIEEFPGEIRKLSEIVYRCFILGRFKRIYATSAESGWPYLSPSEAFQFRPTSERWIARKYAPRHPERHFAKDSWILVSASGTVGRPVLVTQRLEEFFLSHDLVRVIPSEQIRAGYLYAYISSWVGQALLTKDQYGSAINHLEPHHVANIPVPLLPEAEINTIADGIQEAYSLREKANKLLDDAMEMLYRELGLPEFDEQLVEYLPSPETAYGSQVDTQRLQVFTVRASELEGRLDASYHIPTVSTVIAVLKKGRYALSTLQEMSDAVRIPPRFKRIYVSSEYGVPFLRPSHLPQMTLYDLNYIAKRTPALDHLMLNQGDVLISTDGKVGQIGLVTRFLDGWAGSNNIGRVTYGKDNKQNGYLAAFLMSPYGQHQLVREVYGGVVDHIEVPHIQKVLIPNAPENLQRHIGSIVVEAFENKEKANVLENSAIKLLESKLSPT